MGATRNTGYLENLIAYDASNNVAIATTAIDNAFKITMGGSVKMTGALSGTSATFSAEVTSSGSQGRFGGWSTGAGYQGAALEAGVSGGTATLIGYNRTTSVYIPLTIGGNTNQTTTIGGNTIVLQNNGVTALSIASTGAATFSSSVKANNLFLGNNQYLAARNAANTADRTLIAFNSSNAIQIGQDTDITSVSIGVSSANLTISSTGAATFSSSVSAATNFRLNSNSFSQVAILDSNGGFAGGYNFNINSGTAQHNSTGAASGYWYQSGGIINFYTNSSAASGTALNPRMTITSGGNVGIGITNPNGLLSLRVEASNTPVLRFQNQITSGLDAAISSFTSALQTYLLIGTNLFINSSGNFQRFNTSYESSAIAFDEGTIGFSTNTNAANATRRMTITSGGNVGIGSTAPTSIGTYYTTLELKGKSGGTGNEGGYLLTVDADGSTTGQFGTDGNYVYFGSRSNTDAVITTNNTERMRITSGGQLELRNDQTNTGFYIINTANASTTNKNTLIQFRGTDTGNTVKDSGAIQVVPGGVNYIDASMIFYTRGSDSQTERMRITSDNVVLIGTTSTSPTNSGGMIFRATNAAYGGVIILNHSTTNNVGSGFLDLYYNANYIGGIQQNGASNVLYNTSSDYRLKKDLKDFNGLDIVSRIKTYDFAWKIDDSRMYGVIAHELQEIIPYVVSGNKDEVKENGKIKVQAVDYSKVVPVLVKAIQEQQEMIEELKNKLA